MNKTCGLRMILGAIALIGSIFSPNAHVFAQSTDAIQQQIVKTCNRAARSKEDRAACQKYHLDQLREFITLRDSYPKDSKQYQALVACTKEWPQDVIMWRMCASRKVPEEAAFKYGLLETPTWAGQQSSEDLTGEPEEISQDAVKKMIIRRCQQTENTDEARAACRTYQLERLKEYVVLLNSYPKDSAQYKTLVACSEKWPEAIVMWKTCASQAMPEELAFKPFSLADTSQPYLQFNIDPRDTVADQNGRVPLMPFTVDLAGQPTTQTTTPTRPSMFISPDGVYIPGGVPE